MTVGTDVEFFFTKNGQVVPAEKFLPFKENPLRRGKGDYHSATLHADGIQGELTTKYNGCRAHVVDSLHAGIYAAYQIARENNVEISILPSMPVSRSILDEASPKGREFGCDPDLIAWLDGAEYVSDIKDEYHERRYSGGHIHIGATYDAESLEAAVKRTQDINERNKSLYYYKPPKHLPACLVLHERMDDAVKLLDITLGNLSVLLDQDEGAKERRELYGKAGFYRRKPYGLEYRVLGNFYIKHPSLFYFVTELARYTIKLMMHERDQALFDLFPEPAEIIMAINNNDKEQAWKNWLKVKPLLLENDLKKSNVISESSFKLIEFLSVAGLEILGNTEKIWCSHSRVYHGNELPDWGKTLRRFDSNLEFTKFSRNYSMKEMYL